MEQIGGWDWYVYDAQYQTFDDYHKITGKRNERIKVDVKYQSSASAEQGHESALKDDQRHPW